MKKFAAVLLSFIALILSADAEKPILRAGIITDTHVTPDPASVGKLQQALLLFKSENVDLVINAGDIADKFHPAGYRHYRNTVKKVFPQGIREIFAYANHDQVPTGKRKSRHPYSDVKNALQIPHEPWDTVVIRGIPFVTCPQLVESFDDYEKHLADAVAKFPDKPVFVVDHVPPYNTTDNTLVMGCPHRAKILKKFPQVIHISGHVHGDIRNELLIWQDEYTAVNAGCLSGWQGQLIGSVAFSKRSAGVLIMDVYSDRVVIHRKDCISKKTVAEPWTIPLPHSPENPPLSFQNRQKASTAPEFPAGSAIKTTTDSEKFNDLIITFEAAQMQKNTHKYEILLKNRDSKTLIFRQEIYGDFYRDDSPETVKHTISAAYLESGRDYLIEIVPLNFFGKRGKSLVANFTAPEKAKWTTVFESNDPMGTLECKSGLTGDARMTKKDGFYILDAVYARMFFPGGTWTGKAGTRFRFTVDIHTRDFSPATCRLVLRHDPPKHYATGRLTAEHGNSGIRRYVFDFIKKQDFYNYFFLVRSSSRGEFRIEYIKIERLD